MAPDVYRVEVLTELERIDQAEEQRLRHVRPAGWQNPQPAAKYDMVVLGGGTAGLVCAMGAAGLGARVALVERHLLGGDCLNTGCVPSKALIRSARAVGELRKASSLGVETSQIRVDFPAVMQRVRVRRAEIAPRVCGMQASMCFSATGDSSTQQRSPSARRGCASGGRSLRQADARRCPPSLASTPFRM